MGNSLPTRRRSSNAIFPVLIPQEMIVPGVPVLAVPVENQPQPGIFAPRTGPIAPGLLNRSNSGASRQILRMGSGLTNNRRTDPELSINADNNKKCTLRIITVNDVYSIDNLPRLAMCKKQESQPWKGANKTIAVLPGDFLAPSILSSMDKGSGMVECMNQAGIDYVCFGNHEADIPYPQLKLRIKQSTFQWINSNMRDIPLDSNHLHWKTPPYVIIKVPYGPEEANLSRRVALLGLNTNDKSLYKPGAFGGCGIDRPNTTAIQLYAHLMREEQVDVIIPMTHQDMRLDRELAETTLFPLIIGGHDHDVYLERFTMPSKAWTDHTQTRAIEGDVSGNTIIKTGKDAQNIAICDLTWEDDLPNTLPRVSISLKKASAYEELGEVKATVKKHNRIVEELNKAAICEIPKDLLLSSQNMRLEPTTMGAFICSILRSHYRADCALINAGSVRGNKDYSNIQYFTYAHLKAEMPLPTEIIVLPLPGWVIANSITFSRAGALLTPPEETGAFLHHDDRMVYDPVTQTILTMNRKPFDIDVVYQVALPKILLNGVDNIEPLLKYRRLQPNLSLMDGTDAKDIVVSHFCAALWGSILSDTNFEDIDTDGNGIIDKNELVEAVTKKFGKEVSLIMVNNVFSLADAQTHDGFITKESLARFGMIKREASSLYNFRASIMELQDEP